MSFSFISKIYPDAKRKIFNADSNYTTEETYTEKTFDGTQKDFHYKDISGLNEEVSDQLIDYVELYEKHKVPYMNVFYRVPLMKKC